ncbi:MAG TPA: diacylglycerol kinase family protein [Solirubrobacteraceae bacterium]|nr:diacylglycerol kinase family protein [Solirubrobacteraceae bacterium]
MTERQPAPVASAAARPISLIVNPSAGGGRAGRLLGSVGMALSARGLSHHVELTRSLEHAAELAAVAAAAGELAAAFGGDGLIAAVAGALRDSDGILGILPGGRGNDLARVLGIPADPVAACEVLARGVVRRLDLGEVAGRTFLGIASCGFDSDANRIANQTRLVKGNLVYAYGAVRALVGWRPATFEVTLDGARTHVVRGYSVGAANNKAYGGGMYAAPDAELDDGLLDVVTLADMPKARFLTSLMPKVFKGTHVNEPEVTVWRAAEVAIAADRPFTLYADGDPIAELPVTIRVLPRAVQAILPH